MKKHSYFQKGITLVEVLVATAIILSFLIALISVHNTYLRSSFSNLDEIKATYLAEEGIEAVKGLRDASWTTNIAPLVNGTSYYLVYTGTLWATSTTFALIDSKYTRKVVLSAVNRDASSDITTSGGSTDANTRKVNVTVSWSTGSATSTRSIDTYITNLFGN